METPTRHSAARSPQRQSARTACIAPSADARAGTAARCNRASAAAPSHPACARCTPGPRPPYSPAAGSAIAPSPTAPARDPPTCTSPWRQYPSLLPPRAQTTTCLRRQAYESHQSYSAQKRAGRSLPRGSRVRFPAAEDRVCRERLSGYSSLQFGLSFRVSARDPHNVPPSPSQLISRLN